MSDASDLMSRRAQTEEGKAPPIETPFRANGEDADTANARTCDNTPSLHVSTSFDSETDSGAFHLTMAPLHALQALQASLTPPGNNSWSREEDLVEGPFMQRALFPGVDVDVDDDDFEILPDDDDIGDDAAKYARKLAFKDGDGQDPLILYGSRCLGRQAVID